MRKFLSLLAAILFAGSMLAAVGNVFYTFVPQKLGSGNVSDYSKSGDQEIDGLTWTVPGNWYGTGALRLGGKSIENVDRSIIGKSAIGDAIAKIVITHAGINSTDLVLNTVKLTVASDAEFSADVETKTLTLNTDYTVEKDKAGTIEFTPAGDFWAKNSYYKFDFNFTNTNSSNRALTLNKIEFYSYSDVEITHWTVAGSSATLFGTTWEPANKDNEMIQQEDGSFKWEKTELELAEGTIAFKVCKNYTWDEAYPAKDYELAIPGAGIYTVTINFNPESKEIAAVADKTGEAVVLPTVVLHGNFFGEWKDTDPFAPAEDKLTARLNLTLAEGNYEFGFKFDGAWKANGAHITREAPTTSLAEGSGNMHFAADAAGEYQLTYTFESQTLEVVYPKKPEVLPEGAFKLTFNGTGEAGKDASAALAAEVEAIFDAASAPYVASVETATKVYAGRPIADDNSSLKFGTSSAAGTLAFTLATPVEVDSIIVNAAQYGNDAAEVTVNGVKFDLTAGNKVPTDCKLVANGEISQITIEQTGSQRIYVRSVKVFPKAGEVPPVDEPKFYITGTANLVGEESAWQPNALPVKEESAVLSLEPGAYMMKVTLKGNWTEGVLGFDELTGEIPEGVTRGKDDDDNNICFTLAEAGDVTVTYTGEVFTIAGNFYVEPAGDPTVTVIGDMTEWAAEIPFILSEDKKTATLYNDNIKAGTYEFKLKVNGEWRSNGYEFHRGFPGCAGISGNTDANMTVVIDVEGAYTFEWYFANDSLAIKFPAKPEPVLTDGYYLVGSFSDWKAAAENLFVANPDAEGEYQLNINLTAGDEIKVAYVEADAATTWFPKEGNYIVDANHSGATTMYFRPDYKEEWAAFGGYFYIVPTGTEGIEEILSEGKAVKVIREGNLIILKGDKAYNAMGQIVK